jgi:DNA end-binding protein Ku
MAKKLIESMSATWDPSEFKDDYREKLEQVIEAKLKNHGRETPTPTRKTKTTNVIDLAEVLQASIRQAQSKKPATAKRLKKAA